MTSTTARLEYSLSYSTYTGKTWLAKITGRDTKYGYSREFVSGRRTASKSGKTGSYTYLLDEGLYEECERGERLYRIVFISPQSGEITIGTIGSERAEAIAARIDAGESFESARAATKPVTA